MARQLKPPAELAEKRILELRGLLHGLTDLTKDLGPETTVHEAVGVGRELWRVVDLAHKRLNVLKERLRDEVEDTPGKYRFAGPGSSEGLVQVPEPAVVFRKGTDLMDLSQGLGQDLFGLLFGHHCSWKPTKDFQDIVAKLAPDAAKMALDAVDMQTNKTRVTFIRRTS